MSPASKQRSVLNEARNVFNNGVRVPQTREGSRRVFMFWESKRSNWLGPFFFPVVIGQVCDFLGLFFVAFLLLFVLCCMFVFVFCCFTVFCLFLLFLCLSLSFFVCLFLLFVSLSLSFSFGAFVFVCLISCLF